MSYSVKEEIQKRDKTRNRINFKHLLWVIGLILITLIICSTLIWINSHSWTIRFEMDDNTLGAVKSINWSAMPK